MRIRPLFLLLALLLCGGVSSTSVALGGVPDPRNCVADTCLVVSPAGAFAYKVTVKDESAAPVANLQVVLDFGTASGIVLCDASDPDHDRRVLGTTDITGSVTFRVRGGGQTTGYVVVSAVGQVIVIAHCSSPDLNGDLAVTSADATLLASLPSTSLAGDFDCDGTTDSGDAAILAIEVGQDCNTVPVLDFTWGAIKASYR